VARDLDSTLLAGSAEVPINCADLLNALPIQDSKSRSLTKPLLRPGMDHMKTATVRELRNEFPRMPGPLEVTTLLLYEFRQAVRFQIRLHRQDAAKGYPRGEGTKMMADLKAELVLFLLGKLDLNPA
jgi:hypothetical protein